MLVLQHNGLNWLVLPATLALQNYALLFLLALLLALAFEARCLLDHLALTLALALLLGLHRLVLSPSLVCDALSVTPCGH